MKRVREFAGALLGATAAALGATTADAANWQVGGGVSVNETFSDNANLAPDNANPESDLISQVTPSLSLSGEGARARAALNFSHSQIYTLNDTTATGSQNTLQSSGNLELWRQRAFIDAQAAISQQVTSLGGPVSQSEAGQFNNRTEVRTVRVAPSLRNHIGSFAETNLSGSVGHVSSESGAITESTLYTANASISSGRRFTSFLWSLNGNRQETLSKGVSTASRTDAGATVGLAFSREFTVDLNGGYQIIEDNLQANTPDGVTWSVGGTWRPSPRSSLHASYGRNFGTTEITFDGTHNLSRRTSLSASFSTLSQSGSRIFDSQSITVTGSHEFSPTSGMNLSYNESTQTSQGQDFDQLAFLGLNQEGSLVDTRTGLPFVAIPDQFGVTNATFKSRSVTLSARARSRRTALTGALNYASRETTGSGVIQMIAGASVGATTVFDTRTSGSMRASYQWTDFDDATGRVDQNIGFGATLSYRIFRNTSANIAYTLTKRLSNVDAGKLTENAVTVALSQSF